MHLRLVVISWIASVTIVVGQDQLKAFPFSPDYSEVLAEGPFTGSIEYVPAIAETNATPLKHDRARILFVTQTGVYFQETAGGATRKLTVEMCRALRVTASITNDRGRSVPYQWDAEKEKSNSKMVSSDRKLAVPQPLRTSKKQTSVAPVDLELFLVNSLTRLNQKADASILAGDVSQQNAIVQIAERRAKDLARTQSSPAIRNAFAALPAYISKQQGLAARVSEIAKKSREENEKESAARSTAFAMKNQAVQMGMLNGLLGAFANGSTYRVDWSDGRQTTEFEPDILGGILIAGRAALNADQSFQQQMKTLNEAKAIIEDKLKKQFEAAITQVQEARAANQKALSTVQQKDNSTGTLVNESNAPTYDAEIAQELKRGPQCNLFTVAELCFEQALRVNLHSKGAAEVILSYAEKIDDLLLLVPVGAAYDVERLELLSYSIRLTLRAATTESSTPSWHKLYSPRAAQCLRHIEEFGELKTVDASGDARQLRALALLMLGQSETALEQLEALVELRKRSADFHVVKARTLALTASHIGTVSEREAYEMKAMTQRQRDVFNASKSAESKQSKQLLKNRCAEVCRELEAAIDCGLRDPAAVSSASEFSVVRTYQQQRYDKIVTALHNPKR